MTIPMIANPERGCGTLKKGGFYGGASSSGFGVLERWTWCLSSAASPMFWKAPARQMTYLNLGESLHNKQVSETVAPDDSAWHPNLLKLNRVALLDHVGKQHYNPCQFADEIKDILPSRRMSPAMAKMVVDFLPIPIIFTHSQIPVIEPAYRDDIMQFLVSHSTLQTIYDFGYSHEGEEWGITRGKKNGGNHFLLPLMRELQQDNWDLNDSILPPEFAEHIQFAEQPFGISWITEVRYVCKDNESPEYIEDLERIGIQPVRIEE